MIAKSEWKALASLSQKIAGSSATILNDVLYSIGGDGSTSSVCWLDLLNEKAKWSLAKTLGQSDFSDHRLRDATVVKNTIIYFGSSDEKATYVLKQIKDSSFCRFGDRTGLHFLFSLILYKIVN